MAVSSINRLMQHHQQQQQQQQHQNQVHQHQQQRGNAGVLQPMMENNNTNYINSISPDSGLIRHQHQHSIDGILAGQSVSNLLNYY